MNYLYQQVATNRWVLVGHNFSKAFKSFGRLQGYIDEAGIADDCVEAEEKKRFKRFKLWPRAGGRMFVDEPLYTVGGYNPITEVKEYEIPAFLLKANQPTEEINVGLTWKAAKPYSFTAYLLTDKDGKTVGHGNWPPSDFVDDLGIWPFISDAERIRQAKDVANTKGLVQKGGVHVKS